jgi:hypothetical protein
VPGKFLFNSLGDTSVISHMYEYTCIVITASDDWWEVGGTMHVLGDANYTIAFAHISRLITVRPLSSSTGLSPAAEADT